MENFIVADTTNSFYNHYIQPQKWLGKYQLYATNFTRSIL